MPRVTLATQVISRTGLKPTYTTVNQADGAQFSNSGASFLEVVNTGAAPVTVTVIIQSKLDGQSVTNRSYTVPNTTTPLGNNYIRVGPFPPSIYNTPEGLTYVDVSANGCVMGVFQVSG